MGHGVYTYLSKSNKFREYEKLFNKYRKKNKWNLLDEAVSVLSAYLSNIINRNITANTGFVKAIVLWNLQR